MDGCLRRSRVAAEKRWPQKEKSAHNGHEARPRSLKGRESNERNPETGAAGKKNEKTSDALNTGGHAVTIDDIPSLEWFQVHPNGKSRLTRIPGDLRPGRCAGSGEPRTALKCPFRPFPIMTRPLLIIFGVLLSAAAAARAEQAAGAGASRIVTDEDCGFWSFRPLERPRIPTVNDAAELESPIDAFIAARLGGQGLQLASTPPRERLIRRATLTLIGLPPTPEEVARFVADTDPDAWAKVVDRLLASPHYGEKWASHWLDVARFAESYGFEHDVDNDHAWHYRDFVIRALNDDFPFDRFVRWQLAGDEIVPDDARARIATGFLAAGVHNASIAQIRVEQERYDELDDLVSTVGSAFLGLSVGCARCHDHPHDPIAQEDYYRLVAQFERTIRA